MDVKQFGVWADELFGIEEATASDVGFIFQSTLNKLFGLGVALWPGDDASRDDQRAMLGRLNVDALEASVPEAQDQLRKGALLALAHGFRVARAQVQLAGVIPARLSAAKQTLGPSTGALIDVLPTLVRVKVVKANVLLRHATTMSDVLEGLAIAKQAQSLSVGVARHVTNESSNDALTAVSHATSGMVSIWRAEPSACLHCLAYQGQIDSGTGYPAGLTFGAKPLNTGPVGKPPLHPNCRCTQFLVEDTDANGLAVGLKREAKRSVLRGWSMPSESETARLAAAKRLVNQGNTLPKSVNAYAEASVQAGEFKRGRTPPG